MGERDREMTPDLFASGALMTPSCDPHFADLSRPDNSSIISVAI